MKACVIVFPGSNCDMDTFHALKTVAGFATDLRWHRDTDLTGYDLIVIPGGFSYGDHLRAGAIARFAPALREISDAAARGVRVLGICNGFQILLEAGLLPGAMLRNDSLRFRHEWVKLRVDSNATPFTSECSPGQILRMPIAHGEGSYFADAETISRLQDDGRVGFTYTNCRGQAVAEANPNGSLSNIAAIASERGNVMGMMPHPERCSEAILGGRDGAMIWRSLAA